MIKQLEKATSSIDNGEGLHVEITRRQTSMHSTGGLKNATLLDKVAEDVDCIHLSIFMQYKAFRPIQESM